MSAGSPAKWGVQINVKYAINRLLHIWHTINCIFLHIFTAYFFLHIWLIQSIYLHILCIFFAYYWHISAYFTHIKACGMLSAYLKHISCIFRAYLLHTNAYFMHTTAYYLNICAYLSHILCIYFAYLTNTVWCGRYICIFLHIFSI